MGGEISAAAPDMPGVSKLSPRLKVTVGSTRHLPWALLGVARPDVKGSDLFSPLGALNKD